MQSSRQLSWGRSFEQSSSRWLGTSPAVGGEKTPMEGVVWVSGVGKLPFRITPACKEIMVGLESRPESQGRELWACVQ